LEETTMQVMGGCQTTVWQLGSILALLMAAGCQYHVREVATLPLQVEVHGPEHLQVAVIETGKRALAPTEFSAFERAGYRWDHTVRFTETAGVAVQFREVQATVRSLSGVIATRTIPLGSRVEPQGTTPILVDARLSTSNPEEPENLTGVEEVEFFGQDDRGTPVRVVVRIPLE
jgi:hypothetical protein